ncbi:MAG: hydrolase [Flavobacteriales bacterium]|nr:hydrolase [Flavobacteriales bacterium]
MYRIFIFLFFTIGMLAQNNKKELVAKRIQQPISIDGVLEEEAWNHLSVATNFVMFEPDNGVEEPKENRTEVKILYDDEAIYIGAILYDSEPNKIMKEITQRDRFATSDHFGVFINGFNDGQQDFRFFVSAAGTQMDAVALEAGGEDFSWDGIWKSAVKITDFGWVIEMKIPYAALRFSVEKDQVWGLNFLREFRRLRYKYTWNHIDLKKGGIIRQAGVLKGISNIQPPLRLFFIPYTSGYHSILGNNQSSLFKAGMDVKYGINDAYTLDAVLVPDFGQAAFDNVILNLGPFEQQFNENRPFFTEGTDLFNKGGLLYTRRIGGPPTQFPNVAENEKVQYFPSAVNMINATKISGRGKDGLGIGFLNAITERTEVLIENEDTGEIRSEVVEPLTNFNVTVFDQRFNQNSSVTVINTNVTRSGHFRDANVLGVLADLNTKKNTYNYGGSVKMSSQYGLESKSGVHWESYFGKTYGKFRYNAYLSSMTKDYDINDLGINFITNYTEGNLNLNYRILNPTKIFNSFSANTYHYFQYNKETGKPQESTLGLNINSTTLKNDYFGFGGYVAPTDTYDYYDPRVEGRFLIVPKNWGTWYSFSSNYNRKFALDLNFSFNYFDQENRSNWNYSISPRYRFSDKLNVIYRFNFNKQFNDVGWTGFQNQQVILGLRDRDTYTQTVTAKYGINQDMTFNLSVRHYWSVVQNNDYLVLLPNGTFAPIAFDRNRDNNFGLWNLDFSYVWWFAPGSQMSFLYRNTGNQFINEANYNFGQNFSNLFENNLNHTFSVSIRYFLEYEKAKKWLKSKT